MALGSVSSYKTYAGVSGSGDDTLLAALLAQAEATMRRLCDRSLTNGFESASRTEYYDGTDAENIQLKEWPVTTISSVQYVEDDGSLTDVASTFYRANLNTGTLYAVGSVTGRFALDDGSSVFTNFKPFPRWERGKQNIKVVYTGGYGTVPKDLEYAVYRLMDSVYAGRGSDPSKQSESIGDYSYTMQAAADRDTLVNSIVASFRTGGL